MTRIQTVVLMALVVVGCGPGPETLTGAETTQVDTIAQELSSTDPLVLGEWDSGTGYRMRFTTDGVAKLTATRADTAHCAPVGSVVFSNTCSACGSGTYTATRYHRCAGIGSFSSTITLSSNGQVITEQDTSGHYHTWYRR
jgi:hypothetical protein